MSSLQNCDHYNYGLMRIDQHLFIDQYYTS